MLAFPLKLGNILCRLHKPRPVERPESSTSATSTAGPEDDVFAELEGLMGPDMDAEFKPGQLLHLNQIKNIVIVSLMNSVASLMVINSKNK